MNHREELSSMFDYDRWANLKWMHAAQELGQESILLHVVDAQIIWLSRIESMPRWAPTIEQFPLHLERSIRNWKRMLLGADLDRIVSYTTLQGADMNNKLSEIVRHVINHGTYHRGHLRGLADAKRVDFPETDYIAFLRDNAGLTNLRTAAVVEAFAVPTVT
jgi:uncharacterized damage-inducible protein DinB